jgi:hypothetical protein
VTEGSLIPTFVARLADPAVQTVMLCGCGGGFDFVHAMTLVPELVRLGKRVVIGSYSFGDPVRIGGAEVVFAEGDAIAFRVDASCRADPYYGPEVAIAAFLDERAPDRAPHSLYAYYARAFSPPTLARLYAMLVERHAVDAIVLVDGGSDSLMVGDEEGLGDPIEDAVSVAAVASLSGLRAKILISVGLGADRWNHVSDAASLRAIAELTSLGGYLGAVALEPAGAAFEFYRACVESIYARQEFRSVLAGAILAAGAGRFGPSGATAYHDGRVADGELFLWPLMAILWGFDVDAVAARSQLVAWLRTATTVEDCHAALRAGRAALGDRLREIEDLPRHRYARSRRR